MKTIFALACTFLVALVAGSATAFEGSGEGALEGALKVKGCGPKAISEEIWLFYMDPKGGWSMETAAGVYSGTYNELKADRKFSLVFDQSSMTNVLSGLGAIADQLCGVVPGSAMITDPVIKTFAAKLNKKRNALQLDFKLTGIRDGDTSSGKVSYRVKAKLPFQTIGCGRDITIKRALTRLDAVTTADLNSDDAMDIVFTMYQMDFGFHGLDELRTFESSRVVVYLQDELEPGQFSPEIQYMVLPVAKNAKDLGSQLLSVAVGDLDADGGSDIAVTVKDMNSVGILKQDPGYPGQFLPVQFFPAATLPRDIAIGDLDGDGFNDMAVAGENLVILRNDPLLPGSVFAVSDLGVLNVSSVAIADLNGDGRNDVAATTGNTVVVLFQDSLPAAAGNFRLNASYVTGVNAADVAIADLNEDTLPDLAVANRGSPAGSVTVLLQDAAVANGSFLPGTNYPTAGNSVSVRIKDLNGDSLPDLAAANDEEDGGSVSVLLQDHLNRGIFLAANNYAGMHGPEEIDISDVNGDGLDDIVVADKCNNVEDRAYIRYQDINKPGKVFYPVSLP